MTEEGGPFRDFDDVPEDGKDDYGHDKEGDGK